MTAPPIEPDAAQVEALQAHRLLELVGAYTRRALALPEQVEVLQSITANLLFENAALRWQADQLAARVDVLERQRGYRQLRSEEITLRDVVDHETLRTLADRVTQLERKVGDP